MDDTREHHVAFALLQQETRACRARRVRSSEEYAFRLTPLGSDWRQHEGGADEVRLGFEDLGVKTWSIVYLVKPRLCQKHNLRRCMSYESDVEEART